MMKDAREMKTRTPLKVPESLQAVYDEITNSSDAFCREYLNEEYADLARKMAATLARKRPSPLVNGRADSWAAGILYTLGQVNFLFDKSQSPHMRADELCKRIGVSQQTAGGRAQKIREMLDIFQMHPDCARAVRGRADRRERGRAARGTRAGQDRERRRHSARGLHGAA